MLVSVVELGNSIINPSNTPIVEFDVVLRLEEYLFDIILYPLLIPAFVFNHSTVLPTRNLLASKNLPRSIGAE